MSHLIQDWTKKELKQEVVRLRAQLEISKTEHVQHIKEIYALRAKLAGAPPLPSIGDGKDGEQKPVLGWMHDEVVRQMAEHPSGTCQVCDARRTAMSAQSPQSGREEK